MPRRSLPPASVVLRVIAALLLGGCATAQQAPPKADYESVGLGGGGAMYSPASSPHDPNLMFVSSDMSGVYRSEDGGRTWRMLDKRQLRSATSCCPVFHPTDPNVVYAFGDGSLRVSRDRGVTWAPLTTDPPWGEGPVLCIALDRGSPQRMFVGTDGAAYRSLDGGTTWEQAAGVTGRVVGIHVDQTNPPEARVCFAGTSEGVFRSTDGGATWEHADNRLPSRELRGFCGGSVAGGEVILYCTLPGTAEGGRYVGGVYRSRDRGTTWESAMGAGINQDIAKADEWGADDVAQYSFLAMAETHPRTVYATTRGTGYWPPHHWTVWRTDDAGESWRYCYTGDPRGEEHNVEIGWVSRDLSWGWGGSALGFNVNAGDPETALYTNAGELYLTRDGGATWQCGYSAPAAGQGDPAPGQRWGSIGLEDTSCWQFAFDPADASRCYIAYTDIGFARSEDHGRTWRHSPTGSPWTNTFYQIVCDPDRAGVIYAACSNQHDIPHWTSVEGARAPGGVCVSTDHGVNWTAISNGLPEAPVTSIALDPTSPVAARTLYAASFGHGLYKTTDGGASWRDSSAGLGTAENRHIYSVKRHADGTLFCSITGKRQGMEFTPGGLYRSTDGGASWECITASLTLHWPGDFDLDPNDSNTIYLAAATAPQHEEGGIYKTTDGGKRWERLPVEFPAELLSYVQAFFVTVNPQRPDVVYLGTATHGLFVTQDAGRTWREMRGVPFTACQRVAFDPQDPNTIWVTTFGGGVWRGPALPPG